MTKKWAGPEVCDHERGVCAQRADGKLTEEETAQARELAKRNGPIHIAAPKSTRESGNTRCGARLMLVAFYWDVPANERVRRDVCCECLAAADKAQEKRS